MPCKVEKVSEDLIFTIIDAVFQFIDQDKFNKESEMYNSVSSAYKLCLFMALAYGAFRDHKAVVQKLTFVELQKLFWPLQI